MMTQMTLVSGIMITLWHPPNIRIYIFPGFDPFHETQKGLADLLESEAAAQAQHQAKVSRRIIRVITSGRFLTLFGWTLQSVDKDNSCF